jgi:hypothetical protein
VWPHQYHAGKEKQSQGDDRRGNREIVADSLFFPAAITFGPDDNLYISNKGFGPPQPGEILRMDVPGAHDWRWDLDMERDDDD